jgi:hypothetical protein
MPFTTVRISHQDGDHLVCLSDPEALALVEACALMVLAVESDPRVSMPPQMGTVLCELFEGLRSDVGAKTC